MYVGVYVDLCLLGSGVPLVLGEEFLFSRVICCLNGIRSPMLERVVGRGVVVCVGVMYLDVSAGSCLCGRCGGL